MAGNRWQEEKTQEEKKADHKLNERMDHWMKEITKEQREAIEDCIDDMLDGNGMCQLYLYEEGVKDGIRLDEDDTGYVIVCFEGSRSYYVAAFCLFREENRGEKKSNTGSSCTKNTCHAKGGVCLSGGPCPGPWWPAQEVPNGISSTEGKNINHLRRDKPSKNN